MYLHVFDWPNDGMLTMPALANQPRRVSLLAAPEVELDVDMADDQWIIHVPQKTISIPLLPSSRSTSQARHDWLSSPIVNFPTQRKPFDAKHASRSE